MRKSGLLKSLGMMILVTCLFLPILGAQAEQTTAFQVSLILVNEKDRAPNQVQYTYLFENAQTGESFPLILDKLKEKTPGEDARIQRMEDSIDLPARNQDGSQAVYLFSKSQQPYVVLDGLNYALSTQESADPKDSAPYLDRLHVLTRQINPQVSLQISGDTPKALPLTLSLHSWAKNSDNKAYQHSSTREVQLDGQTAINLLDVFSDSQEGTHFRDFTLLELSWDLSSIAGNNHFSLSVGEVPGFTSQVSGDAATGFVIALNQISE